MRGQERDRRRNLPLVVNHHRLCGNESKSQKDAVGSLARVLHGSDMAKQKHLIFTTRLIQIARSRSGLGTEGIPLLVGTPHADEQLPP